MNSTRVKNLCKYKKPGLPNDVTNISLSFNQIYIQILWEIMMVHEFLKQKECPWEIIDDEELNPFHQILLLYNEMYIYNIVIDKNECLTPKFHKLLHTYFYIKRHSVFFEKSIGKRMVKEFVWCKNSANIVSYFI